MAAKRKADLVLSASMHLSNDSPLMLVDRDAMARGTGVMSQAQESMSRQKYKLAIENRRFWQKKMNRC